MDESFARKWSPTFLIDSNILQWDRPLPEGYFSMRHALGGITYLKEFLGFEILNEKIGGCFVNASCSKYLADIKPFSLADYSSDEERLAQSKEKILFSGGIDIYRQGIISGTNFRGTDSIAHGQIWIATEPSKIYSDGNGLKNLIFREEIFEKDKEITLLSIVEGYRIMEENGRKARDNARHKAFIDGEGSGSWKHRHGYFGY